MNKNGKNILFYKSFIKINKLDKRYLFYKSLIK